MPATEIGKQLEGLPKGSVFLVLVDFKNYPDTVLRLLGYMANTRKAYGIYVTANRPYKSLVGILNGGRIDPSRFFFIDCLQKPAGERPSRTENCIFVTSPTHLTEISVALDGIIRSFGDGDRFLFVDSLSTLAIYNDLGTILRFSHFLSGKMRADGVDVILISTETKTDEELVKTVSQFCDRIIRAGE